MRQLERPQKEGKEIVYATMSQTQTQIAALIAGATQRDVS